MTHWRDVFYDLIASTALFEHIQSRRSAAISIQHLSSPIVGHLIKLLVFAPGAERELWIRELDTWLDQVDRIYLEPDHVKPSAADLNFWLFSGAVVQYDAEYLGRRVSHWSRNRYQHLPEPEYSADQVLNSVRNIIQRISADIAVPHKFISVKRYLP